MPSVTVIQQYGSQLLVCFDDGSRKLAYPANGLWIVSSTENGPQPSGDIYNPWADVPISGTWEDHSTYSAGGVDLPLAYGTPIPAPADGVLHTSGTDPRGFEFNAGWIGSAGRRSILYLDNPVERVYPPTNAADFDNGPMVAIVFQHLSEFGIDLKHYNMTEICGKSGASANGVDYGGDVHLHVHGLNNSGQRVNFWNFVE